MFKYVYEVAPIDFMDGTIPIENYVDSIISDLSLYKDDLLENVYDDDGNNICMNAFDDNCYMVSEHAFCKLQKIGKDVENICEYFNKKKMKINRKSIRIFSSPTETYCTVSQWVYIFSDLYFPFLNKKDNNVEKFD